MACRCKAPELHFGVKPKPAPTQRLTRGACWHSLQHRHGGDPVLPLHLFCGQRLPIKDQLQGGGRLRGLHRQREGKGTGGVCDCYRRVLIGGRSLEAEPQGGRPGGGGGRRPCQAWQGDAAETAESMGHLANGQRLFNIPCKPVSLLRKGCEQNMVQIDQSMQNVGAHHPLWRCPVH